MSELIHVSNMQIMIFLKDRILVYGEETFPTPKDEMINIY